MPLCLFRSKTFGTLGSTVVKSPDFHKLVNTILSNFATTSNNMDEKYQSGSASVAYVTTPNETTAKKLARLLVEQKLAACVNIIPNLTSIYIWEDKINEDQESLMMIKTKTSHVEELTKLIKENHPYSVVEVITLPIENGNPPYLDWVLKSVGTK